MKKLFVLFLAFFSCYYGFSQTYNSKIFKFKVTYELTYQPDSTDIDSRKSEEMYLYIGDGISRFSSAGKSIGDVEKSNMDQPNNKPTNYRRMRRQIPRTAFNYYIYKGIPAGKMTYTGMVISDKYRYTENKHLFDWTILNETDTLAGFHVQKAITSFAGRNYNAWFTDEIPFSEGPYKFNGLPGLIVMIADERRALRL